jgi:hypothetical protein
MYYTEWNYEKYARYGSLDPREWQYHRPPQGYLPPEWNLAPVWLNGRLCFHFWTTLESADAGVYLCELAGCNSLYGITPALARELNRRIGPSRMTLERFAPESARKEPAADTHYYLEAPQMVIYREYVSRLRKSILARGAKLLSYAQFMDRHETGPHPCRERVDWSQSASYPQVFRLRCARCEVECVVIRPEGAD